MDIEKFREYCLNLPGTTEGMKWGENLCFMIEEKIYAIASLDDGLLSFKIDPENFEELAARDGIAQAAHFAKKQWVTLESLDVLSDQELREHITASRALVISKLPKKTQALYA
ncbi:putative DNA-binding protein (MmcQ/YjbR family) [Pedobacter sp. CAN_A7]|uniref:MmcQ/YjbR family DNA-binding protein n=1 Tax=Pedobacter sp. CAN_A7 TaxID=2787722 RepID=UPI0018C92175